MRRKRIERRLGRDDKYMGLVSLVETTVESIKEWKKLKTPDVLEDIDLIEGDARGVLQKAGFPTDYWGPHDMGGGGKGTLVALLEDRKLEPEWHAAKVLEYAWMARDKLAKKDMNDAVRNGMLMMQSHGYSVLARYEELIRSAQKNRRNSSNPRFTDTDHQNWLRQAKRKIQHQNKRPSNTKLAREIAAQLTNDCADEVPAERTIRAFLDKHLPNSRK